MKIIFAVKNLVVNDAISNDLYIQKKVLKQNGFEVFLFAEDFSQEYSKLIISEELFNDLINEKNNILIYHYSSYWEKDKDFIINCNSRIWLKYHNITPEFFYKDYNREIFLSLRKTKLRIEEIIRIGKVDIFLCDSAYNVDDLIQKDAECDKCKILPPFYEKNHRILSYSRLTRKIRKIIDLKFFYVFDNIFIRVQKLFYMKKFLDGKYNILFVGRFAPNKDHIYILEIVSQLRKNFSNIRLIFAGGYSDKSDLYLQKIFDFIKEKELKEIVEIIFFPEDEIIELLYKISHVFFSASRHEGFCVPILEAQCFGVPVVVRDFSASSETCGAGGIILEERNEENIDKIVKSISDSEYRLEMIEKGRKNLKKFSYSHKKELLLKLLEKI
ncbi:MAG: glycosyltransferase [Candidatus Muirbacterium halophilum]|nr:glycosyltransferase [Candidatus Muirbacterium halophilum]